MLPRYQMEIEALLSMPPRARESRIVVGPCTRFIPVHTHYGVVNMQASELSVRVYGARNGEGRVRAAHESATRKRRKRERKDTAEPAYFSNLFSCRAVIRDIHPGNG